MYERDDVKIVGNVILVKEYYGHTKEGIRSFNWVTFIEVDTTKCITHLGFFMRDLVETFVK